MLLFQRKVFAVAFVASVSSACLCEIQAAPRSGPATQPIASSRVAAVANHVLATVKETVYDHRISIDEKSGKYQCDCSGLVAEILRRAEPRALQAVVKAPNRKRPLAEDFYATFDAAPAKPTQAEKWQHIEQVSKAQPGDLIAWKSLTHVAGDKTDTGHVMIIDESPREVPFPKSASSTNPASQVGQKLYRITIIDSTKSGHADDSRKAGETGVGKGAIFLETDENGRPVGMHWKSPTGLVKALPIAIGRVMNE